MRTDFEKLYDEYYDKIFIYIVCRVGNTHDAEDLTADVFLKVFANPYNPKLAKFSTYIYTIASNALKNYYRTGVNRKNVFTCGEPDENAPCDTDILEDQITREEHIALRNMLAELPLRQYEIVYRRYYLEQSFREIGADMCVSETNANQLHFRAIKNLKLFYKHRKETETRVYNQSGGGGEYNE